MEIAMKPPMTPPAIAPVLVEGDDDFTAPVTELVLVGGVEAVVVLVGDEGVEVVVPGGGAGEAVALAPIPESVTPGVGVGVPLTAFAELTNALKVSIEGGLMAPTMPAPQ
jgi:hypothetical protein